MLGEQALGNPVRVLVTGAGGFIGHHLVSFLRAQGYWVRGVDLKPPEFSASDAQEFELVDLRDWQNCMRATSAIDEVYALAADTGGIAFIDSNQAKVLRNNSLIDLQCIEAARQNGVTRYLYASSAAVYPAYRQAETNCIALKEDDAYPAAPQDASGWEKLLSERLCVHYRLEHGLETRIVRLHNIYGPFASWLDGREGAPAALCRKIAAAQLEGLHEIDIWGDGEQTRSFCYIDDCIAGMHKLMRSDWHEPLNLGQDRSVSINQLVSMIASIAGRDVNKTHILGPQGVRGRNSDNTRIKEVLRWEPRISLEEGLRRTYLWIEKQVREAALEYSFGVATFPPPRRNN